MTGPHGPRSPSLEAAASDQVARLCARGVAEVRVDGAGVSIFTPGGTPDPVHATDERSALVEELQFTLGVGPCFDAVSMRSPVMVGDLADPAEGVRTRWPTFTDEAVKAGIRAVFALPLALGSISLGSLDFYRALPGGLGAPELRSALAVADLLCAALLDGGNSSLAEFGHIGHRAVVHQAAGMISVQRDVTIEEALVVLRSTAYVEATPINQLAADVVAGRRRLTKEQQ
jgi:hypothetical protein